uniref:Uncharacterized protein n=1 Tax=Ciona intestinalis TaxID=7719 RepID=H2XNJ0_CIOIN
MCLKESNNTNPINNYNREELFITEMQ